MYDYRTIVLLYMYIWLELSQYHKATPYSKSNPPPSEKPKQYSCFSGTRQLQLIVQLIFPRLSLLMIDCL